MKSIPKTIIGDGVQIIDKPIAKIFRTAQQIAYEHDNYISVLVVYPMKVQIRSFEKIYEEINQQQDLKGRVVPVYFLVSNGSMGNYFIIYLRK